MDIISTEDSYAERRLVFKNIWDTAVVMEENVPDNVNKPKVIKTLRLDDDDKILIGKKKKERIRNLRAVCNKILDYCDRQDIDNDLFYEQLIGPDPILPHSKPIKLKTHRKKRKIIRAKSSYRTASNLNEEPLPQAPQVQPVIKADVFTKNGKNNLSGIKINRATIFRSTTINKPTVKPNPTSIQTNNMSSKINTNGIRRKIFRKRRTKKKKSSTTSSDETNQSSPLGETSATKTT